MLGSGADIIHRPRISAPGLAHSAIFQVPRGETCRGYRGAEVSGMAQVIRCEPVASMDKNDNRVRPSALRHAEIRELIGIASVGNSQVCLRRGNRENVLPNAQTGCQPCSEESARNPHLSPLVAKHTALDGSGPAPRLRNLPYNWVL